MKIVDYDKEGKQFFRDLEVVNDKNFDRIKDSIPVPKVEPVNCKDCDDTVCCERGKDKLAYCPRCFEKKERTMEFQRERVFTAVNADELRQGDNVITANCMADLKTYVVADAPAKEILAIHDDTNLARFEVEHPRGSYTAALAYLVERKENCTNCAEGRWDAEHQKILCDPVHYGNGNVIFRNHEIEVCNCWKPKTEQKAEPTYKWVNYRPFRDTDELIKVWLEKGSKWQKREITMPFIWVREKNDPKDKGVLITGFGFKAISIGIEGNSMQDLFNDYIFLDGSPCGVEE